MVDISQLSLEELKQLARQVEERIAELQEEQARKVVYLVEKDGYWYIVTSATQTTGRKAAQLCKRLNAAEIVRQNAIKQPHPDEPLYKTYLNYCRLAGNSRTLELGLTVEGARELERLEAAGFTIICP